MKRIVILTMPLLMMTGVLYTVAKRKNYKRMKNIGNILFGLSCFCMVTLNAWGINKVAGNTIGEKVNKTLVVYYSYSHGNTKGIAERVQKALGADIVRLETAEPYPADAGEMDKQVREEVKNGVKPALKPLGVNLNDYDRIIIGTPTWWYKMAPAVLSFLSTNSFKGKTVVPFMTNAGWPGTVIKDMTAVAEKSGATVTNAREFRFSSENNKQNQMNTSEEELVKWIDSLKTNKQEI